MAIIGLILLLAAIGIGSTYYLKDDNVVEETSESVLEDLVEIELALPTQSLKGKIDLTPSSKEMQDS